MISKSVKFLPNTDYHNYLINLSSYKFAVCPQGNGIDTHRFWECLYLKVIPITILNPLTEYYSQYFPIILLNDWKELDINKLETIYINSKWDNYNNLSMNYIYNLLNK